jgi:molecular chaperone DnaK (HSP70)
MLTEYFDGMALNFRLNPDEAVAMGAAVRAGMLSTSEAGSAM